MTIVTGNIRTLANGLTSLGRIRFHLTAPGWNTGNGYIYAPEYVEAVANPANGTFSIDLVRTDQMNDGRAYCAVLHYRDIVDGRNKSYTLGTFFVTGSAGLELADILTSGPYEPTPTDLLSLLTTSTASAVSAAADADADRIAAEAAATAAQIYAGINGLKLRNSGNRIVGLHMGQSWAVSFDANSTGSAWSVESDVRVWSPNGSGTWGVPLQGLAPFHGSGSVSVGIEFCNKLSLELPVAPHMYQIASGGASIAQWVGTPANRTISVGNRPRWVDLQAAISGGGFLPDWFTWLQSVGDHATLTPDEYASEFSYLLAQLTAQNYITLDTPVLVVQPPRGDRMNEGLSSNSFRTPNMVQAVLRLGDPRVRVVDTDTLVPYIEPGGDPAFLHWSDAEYVKMGRNLIYSTWRASLGGNVSTPQDPGVAASMDKDGFVGFGLRRSQIVAAGATYNCNQFDLNGVIEVNAGSIVNFPDLGNPVPALPTPRGVNQFTSAMRGQQGVGITVIPRQAGTVTFNTNGSGFAGVGPLQSGIIKPFVYVVGNREVNVPLFFRWTDGDNWRVSPIGQIGMKTTQHVVSQSITSLAAGASITLTHAAPGAVVNNAVVVALPHAWANLGIYQDAVWVSAADVVSIRVTNTSGVSRTVGAIGVTAIVFS